MIISRNDSSGGTEPKPGFYRDPSFEFMDSTGTEPMPEAYRGLSFE